MEYLIICLVAFFASILTFFSGFGLGTILLPVFALFFPIELAIALTGIVHFCNNIFKLFLVGKSAHLKTVLYFGIPAILFAFIGAKILVNITELPSWYSYSIENITLEITPVKLIIAIILIVFAIFELLPFFDKIEFKKKHLPIGGILSGFFGGLSGHQGALRSVFLIHAGLSKEAFIGTAVVISTFIDFTRLSVYFKTILNTDLSEEYLLLLCAILSAVFGAILGKQLLKKVTLIFLQRMVAILLIVISVALGIGIL
ncbi:MAG: TSUP family transporter [bacterium]